MSSFQHFKSHFNKEQNTVGLQRHFVVTLLLSMDTKARLLYIPWNLFLILLIFLNGQNQFCL